MRHRLSLKALVYILKGHPPSKKEAFSYISRYNSLSQDMNTDASMIWPVGLIRSSLIVPGMSVMANEALTPGVALRFQVFSVSLNLDKWLALCSFMRLT